MSKSPIRSTHTNVVWVAVAVAIIFLAAAGIWGPRVPRPHLNALTAAAPIALVLITIVYVVATHRAASAAERAADAAEVAASSASASAEAGLRQAQLMEEQTTHQALPIVWGAAIGIEDARIKVRVDNVGLGTALNLCLWAVSQAGAHSDTVVLPAPLKGGSELPGLISVNPPPGVPPDLSGLTINAHYKDISNREYMTVTRQGNIEVFEAVTVSGNTTPGAQIISLYEPHRPGSDVGVETALHSDPGRA